MSRAFAPKDEPPDLPRPTFRLPERDDPGFRAAAATALMHGALVGETAAAEEATGIAWGDASLVAHFEQIRAAAVARGDERAEQLADRYLTAARR
ncbi:MAG TPA: hypothetical protein VGM20_04135 [Gemmatimonadales bacterium]